MPTKVTTWFADVVNNTDSLAPALNVLQAAGAVIFSIAWMQTTKCMSDGRYGYWVVVYTKQV